MFKKIKTYLRTTKTEVNQVQTAQVEQIQSEQAEEDILYLGPTKGSLTAHWMIKNKINQNK